MGIFDIFGDVVKMTKSDDVIKLNDVDMSEVTKEELDEILVKLSEETEFGIILRAKGMLPAADGTWLYFDLVPGEYEIRNGAPDYTGRLWVIGSKMDTDKLEKLFKL